MILYFLLNLLFSLTAYSETLASHGACEDPLSPWCQEYLKRQLLLDKYIDQHRDEVVSFATAPLGNSGFPYILLKLAPELFPDLVKPLGLNFERLGLTKDPYQAEPHLPLGLNFSPLKFNLGGLSISMPLQLATLTCGACHIGRVLDSDGTPRLLLGAGNSHFDSTGLFQFFKNIVNHPHYQPALIRSAIAAKPRGWFYPGWMEFLERQIYTQQTARILSYIKESVLASLDQQERLINQTGYLPVGAASYFSRTPGRADAVSLTLALYVNDSQRDKMPQKPTITKIMSVWSQKDRELGHWTADMPSGVYPVVAAAVAVVGDPRYLNQKNIMKSTHLLDGLPPPPYPFAVDWNRALRGKAHFEKYCLSCHVGDSKVYPQDELGTDPWRLAATSDVTHRGFDRALHQGCPESFIGELCVKESQGILRQRDAPLGYVATPLDGIWARAPYLHNGSVPTLEHLLVPRLRPTQFVVGSLHYDPVRVGFRWQIDEATAEEHTEVYITGRPSQINRGHESPTYLGDVDWQVDVEKRTDLIEYMKTL
jgi:hypothetical protein